MTSKQDARDDPVGDFVGVHHLEGTHISPMLPESSIASPAVCGAV
jgi:hypothetical protein